MEQRPEGRVVVAWTEQFGEIEGVLTDNGTLWTEKFVQVRKLGDIAANSRRQRLIVDVSGTTGFAAFVAESAASQPAASQPAASQPAGDSDTSPAFTERAGDSQPAGEPAGGSQPAFDAAEPAGDSQPAAGSSAQPAASQAVTTVSDRWSVGAAIKRLRTLQTALPEQPDQIPRSDHDAW